MPTTDPQPFDLKRHAPEVPDLDPVETVTDALHRNGKPRWEIAKLPRGEWERAKASNDREIASTEPGSGTFARLMEARHRLALPPPEGIALDDISRYAQKRVRAQIQADVAPIAARKRRAMLLVGVLGVLGVALVVLLVARFSTSAESDGPAQGTTATPPEPAAATPNALPPAPATVLPTAADTSAVAVEPAPGATGAPVPVASTARPVVVPPTATVTARPAKPVPTGEVFFDTRP